jgi:predicted nucleotidyltransferase
MQAEPKLQIELPMDAIRGYCARWKITEFALFGSVLRDDFGPDSDVDVLVTFAPDAHWSLFDIVRMQDELSGIVGRDVDLVERKALQESRNYLRRDAILRHTQQVVSRDPANNRWFRHPTPTTDRCVATGSA